jgi:hypothetical protein
MEWTPPGGIDVPWWRVLKHRYGGERPWEECHGRSPMRSAEYPESLARSGSGRNRPSRWQIRDSPGCPTGRHQRKSGSGLPRGRWRPRPRRSQRIVGFGIGHGRTCSRGGCPPEDGPLASDFARFRAPIKHLSRSRAAGPRLLGWPIFELRKPRYREGQFSHDRSFFAQYAWPVQHNVDKDGRCCDG